MRKKILAIDDDPMIRSFVQQSLESTKEYKVWVAADGKEGLRAAESIGPDLILLDVMMPDIDGFSVLRKLSRNKKTRYIPVIMLTGVNTQDAKDKASYAYADGYIVKPVEADKLNVAVSRTLKNRSKVKNF
ncbi:two-component system response regulator [Verrucomicrobiota bacterium]